MHDFEKNQLPNGLNWLFQRIGNVHNRLTRLSSARGLHTQKFNTTPHGLSSLRYSGTKALNCLKSDPAFNKMINKDTYGAYFQIWRLSLTEKSEKRALITRYFVTIDIAVSSFVAATRNN